MIACSKPSMSRACSPMSSKYHWMSSFVKLRFKAMLSSLSFRFI